jgi:hypothetical protein
MKAWMEKIYGYSVTFRLFNTIAIILVVSLGLSAYGIIAFLTGVSRDQREETQKYLDDVSESGKAMEIPAEILEYLSAVRALDAAISGLGPFFPDNTREKMKDVDEGKLQALETALPETTRIAWEPLLAFACRYSPENPPFHFRRFRQRARVLTALLARRKQENPAYSALPIVEMLQRQVTLIELTHRILIGKMIAVAMNKLLDQTLMNLVSANALSGDETRAILAILDRIEPCGLSLRESLEWEFQFMKQSYFKLYRRHGFGSVMCDLVLGNPLDPYREFLANLEAFRDARDTEEFLHKHRRNILFGIMFPNIVKAREQINGQQARRNILKMALLNAVGTPKELPDPFNNGRLATLTINGKEIRYSVGPNLKDDKGTGDDVRFDSN